MEGQSVSGMKGFVDVWGKIGKEGHVVLLFAFEVHCNSGLCL